jgi:SepF-like predicted cell division protein (DUF552 family)
MAEADDGPRWLDVPSLASASDVPELGEEYHDLGRRHPIAPVPRNQSDAMIHRALLHDLTGVEQLQDWLSEGDIVIVELKRLMNRGSEFKQAVSRLQIFIEKDIGGEMVQLGDSRLMLLPGAFRGIEGIDAEL